MNRRRAVILAGAPLAVLLLLGGIFVAQSQGGDTNTGELKALIEHEERDSIAALVFPTRGAMDLGDYQRLMNGRVAALNQYYTGKMLAENGSKLTTTVEASYAPEKIAAAKAAGKPVPTLANRSTGTFDPDTRPIATGINGIRFVSIDVSGDRARVIADVDSFIIWQMRTPDKTTTQKVPTPALFTFSCERVSGKWLIADEQIQYPEGGAPTSSAEASALP